MKLWHVDILSILPRMLLLGQHRIVCAMRGNGWGRSHKVVNYVFLHNPFYLYAYHLQVMREMKRRGFSPSLEWFGPRYRGQNCRPHKLVPNFSINLRYPEHTIKYLWKDLCALKDKMSKAPERKYTREEISLVFESYSKKKPAYHTKGNL